MLQNNRPKRSKQRPESGIHGKHYERKILAVVALKCLLDEDIEDYWILSNPHEVEKFDDIILLTEHRNGDKKLFMIQIKHKDDEKKRPVVAEKLDGNDSSLGLKMYQNAFLDIKQNKDFLQMHEIPIETDTFFILFNNCHVHQNSNENIGFCSTNSFQFIDTSSNPASTLTITNKKGTYNQQFLDQFYFYTEQLDEKSINDEIGSLLGINADAVKSLVNFFYEWLEPKNNCCTKLWKLDVKVQLLDILIGDYLPPRLPGVINKSMLNNVISKFDITVIEQESSVESVWNDIFHEMKPFCNRSPTAWNDYIPKQMENELSSKFKNSETIYMNSEKITSRLVYILLSTQRRVPFFISSNNRLFDSFTSKLQRVLGVYSVVFNAYKDNLGFVKELKLFQDFTNIEEIYLQHSKQIEVSFQGKIAADLYSLLKNHKTVKQQISADNYIKLLQNCCVIGEPNDLPSYYINRQMKVPVLKQEVLEETQFMFFIFQLPMQAKLKNCKSTILEHYESIQGYFIIFGRPYHVITTSKEFNDGYLQRIERLSKDRTYYILNYIDDNYFLLMHTNGCIDVLRSYLTYVHKSDTELIDICKNCKLNLICNNAGMGKSTFLNFINSKFLSDEWVIHIDLKKYSTVIRKLKTLDEMIDFSYTRNTDNVNELFHCFLKPLYKNLQSKIIWLIDDYEEINEPHLLELFKSATKQGFRIWIVARPYLKLEFENAFDVFSMELVEFNKEDEQMFIKKYLKEKDKSERDIKSIMTAINNIRSLLEDSFIGTCQQTMMLTEIFLNYDDQWKEQEWRVHDIYERFIKLKMNDNVYIRTVSKLALKVFFTDKALKKVFDLEEFVEDVQRLKINYPKDFFITGYGEEDVPIFSHRTYAEFLAARWLLHTMEKQLNGNTHFQVAGIIKLLFIKELTGIRLFLDNILTKHLPLHSAIINKEDAKIRSLMNQPANRDLTDLLGRNIFHLLSSYGAYFDVGITPGNKTLIRNWDVHSEVVRSGKYILLKPLETDKPTELNASVNRYSSNIDFISKIRMILKEDNLLKLNSTDYALLSGSLLELDALLQVRNLITSSPLPLTEERKYFLLFHSIQNKYQNILSTLEVKGLNNVKVGHSKMSLLHLAVTARNLDAVVKLTKEHSLVEWDVDNDGNTPLHTACAQMDVSLLRYFLDHMDIDAEYLNKRNVKGQSHLYILARKGTSKLFKEIGTRFPEVEVDSVCWNGNTPFIMSIVFNNIHVATLLKSWGANVRHGNHKNMTALHYAASKGFLQCVKKLIAWGADVNQKDDYGMTPLMKASTWGHKNIILVLLKEKANVNIRDTYKRTALHFAVRRNQIEVVELLLKCRASVNCVNKVGESPLIVACKYNFPKIVKLLLTRNITYGKRLAFRIAMSKKHLECVDLLLQAGYSL